MTNLLPIHKKILPTVFGPIMDRSESVAQGSYSYPVSARSRGVSVHTISDQALGLDLVGIHFYCSTKSWSNGFNQMISIIRLKNWMTSFYRSPSRHYYILYI